MTTKAKVGESPQQTNKQEVDNMDIMMNGYIKGTITELEEKKSSIQLLPANTQLSRIVNVKVLGVDNSSPISVGDTVTCLRLGLISMDEDIVCLKDTDVISYTKQNK